MLGSLLLLSSLVAWFSAPVLAQPGARRRLPLCSQIDRPCRCPRGTTFKNLTSFGIIGAPAIEVQGVMHDFLNLEWQGGLIPSSTTGDGRVVGSTRTFNFTSPNGGQPPYYLTGEVLYRHDSYADGSFVQGIAQLPDPPVVQVPGAGTYYGQYGLIIAQQTVIANETAIAWKNWRCEVGETFPAATSHENGIANTSAILQQAGLRTGVDVTPFTIWYEVRND